MSYGQGGGVIQGTTSDTILVTLLVARDKILRKEGKKSIDKLVVYSSDQAYSALLKACRVGTSSTAVDPLSPLTYAGSACICPEYRHYIDGVDEADSFNLNANKWLLTNFDCTALYVKDQSALIQSLSTNHPEFLSNKASEQNIVMDYKEWQLQLGRRFRSLKLWMVLRMYGLENLQKCIRNTIMLSKQFEDLVLSDPRFEVFSEKFVLPFVVGAPLTEARHIKDAWKV